MKLVYSPNSVIDSIEVAANSTGGLRAYAHARTDATPTDLVLAKSTLENSGYTCQPIHRNGQDVLEIRGFKKPAQLTKCLKDQSLVTGLDRTEIAVNDPIRAGKNFKDTAILTGAGISYNIGDVGYISYAIQKFRIWKNPAAHLSSKELAEFHSKHNLSPADQKLNNATNIMDIVAAIGYAMGSLALTRYGHGDRSQIMIHDTNKKVKGYLEDSGYRVDDDSALGKNSRDRSKGFWSKIDNFCKKYPSEVFNAIYIAVGAFLGAASFYRAVRANTLGNIGEAKEEAIDVGLGAMTFVSALIGLTVREKKIDENDRRHGLGKALDWIQEKPLRAVGLGYAISTGFHAASTYKKIKSNDIVARKTIWGRAAFVASNVISEFLLFFSSKGHGDGIKPDKSVDDSIYAAAADFILQQPESKRELLTSNLAGYLASSDVLGTDIASAQSKLKEQLSKLTHNPWTTAQHRSSKAAPAQSAAVTAEKAPEHQHDRPRATISAARELLPVIEPNKAAAQQLAPAH